MSRTTYTVDGSHLVLTIPLNPIEHSLLVNMISADYDGSIFTAETIDLKYFNKKIGEYLNFFGKMVSIVPQGIQIRYYLGNDHPQALKTVLDFAKEIEEGCVKRLRSAVIIFNVIKNTLPDYSTQVSKSNERLTALEEEDGRQIQWINLHTNKIETLEADTYRLRESFHAHDLAFTDACKEFRSDISELRKAINKKGRSSNR